MALPGKIAEWFIRRYPDQSTEVALRYLPVARLLKDAGVGTVLEIGSGDLGITPYQHDMRVTGLDTAFDNPNERMQQVTGSALKLPFDERGFDAVIAVDFLEHIAPDDRETAVLEMLRVAYRLVVIAVPSGEGAARQDEELAERFLRVRGEEYPFFADHIAHGLPEAAGLDEVVSKALRATGRNGDIIISRNTNLRLRRRLMQGWISRNRLIYNLAVLGLMPLTGLLSRLNFGECYRIIVAVRLEN